MTLSNWIFPRRFEGWSPSSLDASICVCCDQNKPIVKESSFKKRFQRTRSMISKTYRPLVNASAKFWILGERYAALIVADWRKIRKNFFISPWKSLTMHARNIYYLRRFFNEIIQNRKTIENLYLPPLLYQLNNFYNPFEQDMDHTYNIIGKKPFLEEIDLKTIPKCQRVW